MPEPSKGKAADKLSSGAPGVNIFGSDEAIAKAIVSLTKEDKAKLLSELSYDEINEITIALTLGEWLDSALEKEGVQEKNRWNFLKETVLNFLKLRVSKERKGRKEVANVSTWNMFGKKGSKGGGGGGMSIGQLIPGF